MTDTKKKTEFIRLVCAEKFANRVKCDSACAMVFPDVPEIKEIMRPAYKSLQDNCVMRDWLKRKPVFIDPQNREHITGQKDEK